MKNSIFYCLLSLFFCSFMPIQGEETIKDDVTGETFPEKISFTYDNKKFDLKATGVATRKKFIIKLYSAAHYLQDGTEINRNDWQEKIMEDGPVKQLTLKWVRGLNAKNAKKGYFQALQDSLSPSDYKALGDLISQYIALLDQGVKAGDEHILRWLPGGHIEILINGNQAGKFQSEKFAKGLWGIWFGSNSVVNRENLLSLIP